MEKLIKGRCYCCGDGVTVYQIIPEARWTMNKMDPVEMSRWVFEDAEPSAKNASGWFKQQQLSIIVAGKDFGCGSKSVEHPMAALKGAGVQVVLAESFSRYSYRNAINLGLPVMTCPGITGMVRCGDELSVNLLTGQVENHTTGNICRADALGEFALSILAAGGLLPYIQIKKGGSE